MARRLNAPRPMIRGAAIHCWSSQEEYLVALDQGPWTVLASYCDDRGGLNSTPPAGYCDAARSLACPRCLDPGAARWPQTREVSCLFGLFG